MRKLISQLEALDIVRSQGEWITTEEKGEGNCYYAKYKRNIYSTSKYPICYVRADGKQKGQADADLNLIALVPEMTKALLVINELVEKWKKGHTEEEWCGEQIIRILEKDWS